MENIAVKKRGRKPKGGKIIELYEKPCFMVCETTRVQNVILHLKCSKQDLEEIQTQYQIEPYVDYTAFETVTESFEKVEMTLQHKLKELTTSLRKNDANKKADCFWCTCPFEGQVVRIPKSKVNGQYQVYGSFCCPPCAAAFIFSEQCTDTSVKFDRYHLLNYMYGGVAKNFVPAPPPHYLLDKFFGNMSIDEYRKLIEGDQQITVVDKPICVLCPEIILAHKQNEKDPLKTGYKLCRNKVKTEQG